MILRELRFAIRGLGKAPGFTAGTIVMLALGMTLCTTALVVVKAYLLSGMPYPAADRLFWIRYAVPGQQGPRDMEKLDWTSLNDVLEHPVAWDLDMFYLLGGSGAESAPGAWVTPGFVQGLGIAPALGHGFTEDAFREGGPNQVLISHRLWASRFGLDPAITGRTFSAYVSDRPNEAESFTIVGVLPETFWHINPYTEVLAPLRAPSFPYMARLRAGVSASDAAARITQLVRSGAVAVPEGWTATLESAANAHVAAIRPTLRTISIGAAMVFLVACANVAGLLLVRANRRGREIAVRAALGAGRAALARMLLLEGLVLAAAASGASLLLTYLLMGPLAPAAQQQLGRSAPGGTAAFTIDLTVLLFTVAVGACTAVVCSLVPLGATFRPQPLGSLGTRAATEGPRSRRFRSALIAVEIAASLSLLAGSALMLRSVARMLEVDLGFSAEQVLNASVTLRQNRYPDAASRGAAFERMVTALEEMPVIQTAALSNAWPVQQPTLIEVQAAGVPSSAARAAIHGVTDAYFETMSIPLIAGRGLSDRDRAGSEPVAVISSALARRLWPDGAAIGSGVAVPQARERGEPVTVTRRIVGIVADVRQGPGDEELADVYVPMLQAPTRFAFVLAKTHGDPALALPAVRETFRSIDPELSLDRARGMQGLVDALTARPRFMTILLGSLAAVAALLALAGVYGVVAYAVRQREREIAVRLAVGASPAQVVGLFVREGGIVVGAGLALGIVITLAATRVIASELFGVSPRDPAALGAAILAFGLAGLVAVWAPARRAAHTDPAVALRAD
jgi:putative ABC transport system permease protein